MQFEMEYHIHQLEQEAYGSVLRAFKAQSDAITWEKEGLITELRKELRVSDDEHRELLSKVNADDIICRIREWRKAAENHTVFNVSQPMHDMLLSPTVSAPWKKQKTSQSVPVAFGAPAPIHNTHNQSNTALTPTSSAAAKWIPSFGASGKKTKPGRQVSSMMNSQYPSTGPTPRGLFSNNYGSSSVLLSNERNEAARRDPLIGRKVMMRWPDDNNFYEAVITDFNPQEGRHAMVYYRNTEKEAWEWVDLKEIPAEDIRWVDEDPGLSHQNGGRQVSGDDNRVSSVFRSNSRRGNGATTDQFDKELPSSHNGVIEKASDDIEILHTETLILEVQKLLSSNHPDLIEIRKAKKVLKEHEQALVDVISKLADASDTESDGLQRSPHRQSIEGEERRRIALYNSGNSQNPCPEADTRATRANGCVMASEHPTGSDNQQDDDIVEI